MKILTLIFVLLLLIASSNSCIKESVESLSALEKLKSNQYFDAEVFAKPDLRIYGTWKLFSVTGGFSGGQHELGFEFLEIKEYGIYGFVKNGSLLEFGEIAPGLQLANELGLKVSFEKDEKSASFFGNKEVNVTFSGNDTLHLCSPCCDLYDFHLNRVR